MENNLRTVPTSCTDGTWVPATDISNKQTKITMGVLAVINVAVIIQGMISCKHKLQGFPKKTFNIIMFYMLAFLSLFTAILYCFFWRIDSDSSPEFD